jgi:hypothetical protein
VLLIGIPVVGAITRPSPHALRTVPLVIPYAILIAYGIYHISTHIRKQVIFSIIFLLFISYEGILYLNAYYNYYPSVNSLDWGGQAKMLVQTIAQIKQPHEKIFIDDTLNMSNAYITFYEPDLVVERVPTSWHKPEELKDEKILYIRPSYAEKDTSLIKKTIYLNNTNDIYANIWEY